MDSKEIQMKTIQAKIVILGSQGVGKTSMVLRYIDKIFNHQISPTIGASFFTCTVNVQDVRVKLQIWDTAGQERFRSMAPMYYRKANAALLVFDITQYHTFTSIKHWVKELNFNVEETVVLILVGNKLDLSSDRKVSQEEAVKYAESIGGSYFESSALQNEGVEDIILNLAKQLVKLSAKSNNSSILVYNVTENAVNQKKKDEPSSISINNHILLESNSSAQRPAKKSCCSNIW